MELENFTFNLSDLVKGKVRVSKNIFSLLIFLLPWVKKQVLSAKEWQHLERQQRTKEIQRMTRKIKVLEKKIVCGDRERALFMQCIRVKIKEGCGHSLCIASV